MNIPKTKLVIYSVCALIIWWPKPIFSAEKLLVGVAANFILPFEAIAKMFERKTSIPVKGIYNASGSLFAQIINGAPYDLYFSADQMRPKRLFKQRLAEKPFVYARGKVVLWTKNQAICEAREWREALLNPEVNRIAIANPETAPYGAASIFALKAVGMWSDITERLIFSQNVAQVFQYTYTGAVEIGFCAYSSVFSKQGRQGCTFMVKPAPEVLQMACVLKRTKNRKSSAAFVAFLNSEDTQKIKKEFGYE